MREARYKVGDRVFCIECDMELYIHTVFYDADLDEHFYGLLIGEDPSQDGQGHTETELKKV